MAISLEEVPVGQEGHIYHNARNMAIFKDGVNVGGLYIKPYSLGALNGYTIFNFGIDEHERGQGIGSTVLKILAKNFP
jgi:hypothetical protein